MHEDTQAASNDGFLGYEANIEKLQPLVRALLWTGIAYGLARLLFTLMVWTSNASSGSLYELLVQIVSGLSGGGSDFAVAVWATLPAIGGILLSSACLLVLFGRRGRRVVFLLGAGAVVLGIEPWLIEFAALGEMIHLAGLSGLVRSNVLYWFIHALSDAIALSALPLLIAVLTIRGRIP